MQIIESRHLDLYQHAQKAVRFPIPHLGLGELARYFAVPKMSRVADGLQAQTMYGWCRMHEDPAKKAAIKMDLLEYNRDDLEALLGVVEGLSALASERRM